MDIIRVQSRRERKKQVQIARTLRETPEEIANVQDQADVQETGATTEGTDPSERPEPEGRWTRSMINFYLGIFTTLLVVIAWSTNLITKPLATAFGGSVALLGMLIAYFTYRYHRRQERVSVVVTSKEKLLPDSVLAVLTTHGEQNTAIINAALHDKEKSVVFLYLSKDITPRRSSLFEPYAPYLRDKEALDVLGRANYMAQEAHIPSRFIYRHLEPDAAYNVWRVVHPFDMLIAEDQIPTLGKHISTDQVTYEENTSGKVAHLIKHWSPDSPPPQH